MFSRTVKRGRSHGVSRILNRYCCVFLTAIYVVCNGFLRFQYEVDLGIEMSIIVPTVFLIIDIYRFDKDHHVSASLLMSWIVGLYCLVRYLLCIKFGYFVVL